MRYVLVETTKAELVGKLKGGHLDGLRGTEHPSLAAVVVSAFRRLPPAERRAVAAAVAREAAADPCGCGDPAVAHAGARPC